MRKFALKTLAGVMILGGSLSMAMTSADREQTPLGEEFYGILAYSDEQPGYTNHLVSFSATGDGTPHYTSRVGFTETSTAGAYAAGIYYVAASKLDDGKEVPDELYAFDITGGTTAKIGTLEGYNSLINDMSYDYSTSTMYAIARLDNNASALYKIGLSDAKSTKVANLDRRFFTLACNLDGELYGVSFEGDFCKIDKSDGSVHVVGHTGLYPEKFQSMEFDHEQGDLHWACTARRLNESGTIEVQESFMATIDTASGLATRGRSLGNDQIAGLYIPFRLVDKGAPMAVENLQVIPAPNGGYRATLSWKNPVSTFSGEPLKSITKIEVLRDDEIIASITDGTTGIGHEATYIDDLPLTSGAFHTYTVTAYSAAGAGLPNEATTFVGVDMPAAVTNLQLDRLGANRAKLTWQPVTGGANGGWTDLSSLKYTVTRQPDNTIVADGISTCEYEETGVEIPGTYNYMVVASNSAGQSVPTESQAITLGPKLEFPITEEFNEYFTDENGKQRIENWTAVDANKDGNCWEYFNLSWAKSAGAYFMTKDFPGDDWLISQLLEFDPDSTYKMTIRYYCASLHNVELYLLDEYDVENPAYSEGSISLEGGWEMKTTEYQFSVEDGGEFNIALREVTPTGNNYLLIDRIVIEKLVDNNLAATGISGNRNPNAGNTYPYMVKVENRGKEDCAAFTVNLLDQNDNIVGTTTVNETIASGAETSVVVRFTAEASVTSLRGNIVCEEDEISNDNCTQAIDIQVMEPGTPEAIEVGTGTSTTREHPFNLYRKYSAVNEIYTANELGVEKGRIFEVRFPYNMSSYSSVPENIEVKLYLANTDKETVDEWIPLEEMTLVYEGLVNFERGDNLLSLPLASAFDYTGGNLAIVCTSSLEQADQTYYSGLYWYYYSPVEGGSAFAYANDNKFEYAEKSGSSSYYGRSCATFMVQTGGAKVSGKVLDEAGSPVEGAEIRIEPAHAFATTDAEGRYSVDFLPDGSYTLTSSKKYYSDAEPVSLIMEGSDKSVDIVMEKLPMTSVKSRIIDKSGEPLTGVSVKLEGYETLNTVTGNDGGFEFTQVVMQPSSVTAIKDWYAPASVEYDLSEQSNLSDIVMDYAHYTPASVSEVCIDGGKASIQWNTPDRPSEFRYDSGTASSQIGLVNNIATAVMGTAFRTPMLVENLKWFLTPEGGPHNTVNVYVYALDSQGIPYGKPIYTAKEVPNTDGEWTTHHLEEPLSAPNGCLVTLNYYGFLGLGIDDDHRTYPYQADTHYYSTDYASGVFAACENIGLDGNLMIRAEGYVYPAENEPTATVDESREAMPTWIKYNVYRSYGYNAPEDGWTLLTPAPINADRFEDSEFANLNPGVYRYAVCAVYPDGSMSGQTKSPYVLLNAYSDITVNVKTNSHSGNAKGAKVELLDSDNAVIASNVLDDSSKTDFMSIWKGVYTLKISLPGYNTHVSTLDISREDIVSTPVITLEEIIAKPVNLKIDDVENGSFRFTWNESGEIYDSFEDYEVFKAPYRTDMAWTALDLDGGRTYAESDFEFAGCTQPMSFIVFNPSQTSPSMFEQRTHSRPRTGDCELACFASVNGNNDWLITPKLNYHQDFRFSFYAKGYSSTYGEVIRVGYSTTTDNPDDFTWIDEPIDVAKQAWEKYEFEIPAAACYVAVNAISPDGFTLFIDDMEIGAGSGMPANTTVSGPEVEYSVTLDGQTIGNTESTMMLLKDVAEGIHTVGVKALYASGDSEESVIKFGESGIDIVTGDTFGVNPNPAEEYTVVSGKFKTAEIYSLSGQFIRGFDCTGEQTRLDLRGITRGLYILSINDGARNHSAKLIVK